MHRSTGGSLRQAVTCGYNLQRKFASRGRLDPAVARALRLQFGERIGQVSRRRLSLHWTPPIEDVAAVRQSRLRAILDAQVAVPQVAGVHEASAGERRTVGPRRRAIFATAASIALAVAGLATVSRWRAARVPFVEERMELVPGTVREVRVVAAPGGRIEGQFGLMTPAEVRVGLIITDEQRRPVVSLAALPAPRAQQFRVRADYRGEYTLAVETGRSLPRPVVRENQPVLVALRYRVLPP